MVLMIVGELGERNGRGFWSRLLRGIGTGIWTIIVVDLGMGVLVQKSATLSNLIGARSWIVVVVVVGNVTVGICWLTKDCSSCSRIGWLLGQWFGLGIGISIALRDMIRDPRSRRSA